LLWSIYSRMMWKIRFTVFTHLWEILCEDRKKFHCHFVIGINGSFLFHHFHSFSTLKIEFYIYRQLRSKSACNRLVPDAAYAYARTGNSPAGVKRLPYNWRYITFNRQPVLVDEGNSDNFDALISSSKFTRCRLSSCEDWWKRREIYGQMGNLMTFFLTFSLKSNILLHISIPFEIPFSSHCEQSDIFHSLQTNSKRVSVYIDI
jgi:hypothetical protein